MFHIIDTYTKFFLKFTHYYWQAPKIRSKINNLKYNPEIYEIIDDDLIKKLEIRKLTVDNYIVFYRIKSGNIEIVKVILKQKTSEALKFWGFLFLHKKHIISY